MSDAAKIDDLLRQAQRENLHPDPGVRAEARVQRLEDAHRKRAEYVDEIIKLQQQQITALAGMVEALAAEARAK